MSKTFLISDTHFGHSNILTFKTEDGSPVRKFDSVQEMDSHIMENWNRVVGEDDKVYHLGDVCMSNFTHMKRIFDYLNGRKVLIKGNHDNHKLSQYSQIFSDVRSSHVLDGYLLSHIPIHTISVERWKGNIHGHLHTHNLNDKRYFNVSVEQINYTPILFDEVKKRIKVED